MRLSQLAAHNPDAFADLVARMRKLGVVKLGALVLGPQPLAPRSETETDAETAKRHRMDAAERQHNTMFAASSVRPPLPVAPPDPGGEPRAVVQRRQGAAQAARGKRAHS